MNNSEKTCCGTNQVNYKKEYGCTERTRRLKKNLVTKSFYNAEYVDGIYVDVIRPTLVMESYKATLDEEEVIRRSKALKNVLENLPISILKDEIIVGNPSDDPYALPIFPEINTDLMKEAIASGYVRSQDVDKANELVEYFENKTLKNRVLSNLSPETIKIIEAGSSIISTTYKDGIMHCIPNWEFLFEGGIEGLKKLINEKLNEVRHEIEYGNSDKLIELIDSRYLYEAMLISLDGVLAYVDRYKELALDMAEKATSESEKEDYLQVADTMSKTLRHRPTSFRTACQSFFTMQLIFNCIDSCAFGSMIRLDQILYPYFKKDVINEKNITELEAQEIIECLFLKVQSLGGYFSQTRREHFEGNGAQTNFTLGGMTKDGKDACNELTLLALKAAGSIHCNQPTITFFYHDNTDEKALEAVIKTIRTGVGYPAIGHTEVIIDNFLKQGIPLEQARDFACVACVSCSPVDSCNNSKRQALTVLAAKTLELALNEGKCQLTGSQLGPEEKNATEFKTYEEVFEALKKQVIFATRLAANVRNISRYYEIKYRPNPLVSAMHKTPIAKGKDAVSYEDHPNNFWMNITGLINVVNSMAVIKKLVFEEKKYTLQDFINAFNSNWEGYEVMRAECRNKVPKFGNNDPYVDEIGKEVEELFSNEVKNSLTVNGGHWRMVAQSVSIYQATAKLTGALPDGKLKGKTVADGGISPDHGTDKEGVFPVLESVSNFDHSDTKGLLLNQWLAPELLAGEDGIKWMKSYLKMIHEKKVSQIQFNVVDPQVLKDAQKHPENYENLTVRVSGYTANFVKLTKGLQEMIMSRTCQVK